MGFLTTHVLDTARGVPAADIPVSLYKIDNQRALIKHLITNQDGRTDQQLLNIDEYQLGTWELIFKVGAYFANSANPGDEKPFLDIITLRFSISCDDHYHVPLLVSPWSYSTYRGS